MTAALEEGEWSAASTGRTLPPGKTRYTFYRRLGGPQGRPGQAENIVPTFIYIYIKRVGLPINKLYIYLYIFVMQIYLLYIIQIIAIIYIIPVAARSKA